MFLPKSPFEVGEEPLALMSLHLPVLDGRPSQEVIQLHRLVRGHSCLVLSGFLAQPEVDVLLQATAADGTDLN